MLRHILNGTIRGQWPTIQQVCRESTESAKWDLLVGVQLERLPVVSKSLNKIERDYQVQTIDLLENHLDELKLIFRNFRIRRNY